LIARPLLGIQFLTARGERLVSGIAANLSAPGPLVGADGFGLNGRADVYAVATLVAYNIARRQCVTSGLLPMDNLQVHLVVARR
jgi:hypothetical protein